MLTHGTDVWAHKFTDERNTDGILCLFYLPSIRRIDASLKNSLKFQ